MIAALILAATPIALPANLNQVVKVDGRSYRVNVKGRTVKVFNRSVSWARNPEMLARMTRAAEEVTGCAVQHPGWAPGYHWFEGLLVCPHPAVPGG